MTFLTALVPLLLRSEQTPEEILAKSRHAYEQLSTAKVSEKFTVTDESGKELAGTAVLSMKRPGKMNVSIEYAKGGTAELVSDGEHVRLTATKKKPRMVPYSKSAFGKMLPLNIEALCLLDWEHELSTAKDGGMEGGTLTIGAERTVNGRKFVVIEEKSKADDVKDEYYFDAETFLIWKVVDASLRTGKVYSTTEVFDFAVNPALADSIFKLH
ncbi:MAG: hypothetical protein JSS66_14850 [Armatimonadetes bacterium]|nr:hypothetical protein [Armatimonadota bacterium]